MVIQKIIQAHGSDIFCKFECEHCGSISSGQGYNDGYYRVNVLPLCKCPSCGLQSRNGTEKVSYGGFKLITKKELPEGYVPPASYFSGEPKEEGWKECDQHKDKPFLW